METESTEFGGDAGGGCCEDCGEVEGEWTVKERKKEGYWDTCGIICNDNNNRSQTNLFVP